MIKTGRVRTNEIERKGRSTWVAVLLVLVLVVPASVFCQDSWQSLVKQLADDLSRENRGDPKVYLNDFQNVATMRGAKGCVSTYSFANEARCALRTALSSSGVSLLMSPDSADAYLVTWFSVTDEGLRLECQIVKKDLRSTVLAASSVLIPDKLLPRGWDRMNLEDIAYEIVIKMQPLIFNKGIKKIAIGTFTGGEKGKDGLTSVFSEKMKTYLAGQLNKVKGCQVIVPEEKYFDNDAYVLNGTYTVSANEQDKWIDFDLTLLDCKDKKSMVDMVTHRFPFSWVPENMRDKITPPNEAIAAALVDAPPKPTPTAAEPVGTPAKPDTAEPDTVKPDTAKPDVAKPPLAEASPQPTEAPEAPDVEVALWTNKTERIYYDGDPLVVYVKPQQDCHLRVYYICSDNTALQLFPSHPTERDSLLAGETLAIGGDRDDVNLTIRDNTLGQEFIKVFAAKHEINDSKLQKDHIEGKGYAMKDRYGAFTTRGFFGLKGLDVDTKDVFLVREISLVVAKKEDAKETSQ